jgi:hypothetical protein
MIQRFKNFSDSMVSEYGLAVASGSDDAPGMEGAEGDYNVIFYRVKGIRAE